MDSRGVVRPFRFEPENHFCFLGYGSYVALLTAATILGIDTVTPQNVLIYGSLTLGFHAVVELFGRLGFLTRGRHELFVATLAMLVWAISFAYGTFFVDLLRPTLLIGAFLTLNFSVGRGDVKHAMGVTFMVAVIYMAPSTLGFMEGGISDPLLHDLFFVGCFIVSALHGTSVAKHFETLRLDLSRANAETRQANEKLLEEKEKVEKMAQIKTRFFQNISHELRTPLTLILNPLDDAAAEFSGNKRISVAAKNARRLLRLVNQLLDFQKLESGKKELNLVPVDIRKFTTVCGDYFASACSSKNVVFSVEELESAEHHHILGEIDALEKVVFNFLSNALKFTPAGGKISLGVKYFGDRIRVFVRDTGPGISPEDQNKLFQVFSQVESSTTREYEGTGLGLALVRSLAEEMKGVVGIDSEVGVGSVFWAEFPICHLTEGGFDATNFKVKGWLLSDSSGSVGAQDETETVGIPEGTGELILLVDDLQDMRDLISEALRECEYRVVTAVNGKQGLETAMRIRPDLIITDWMMPVMSGPEFIEGVKKDHTLASVPVILLTVKSFFESRFRGPLEFIVGKGQLFLAAFEQ